MMVVLLVALSVAETVDRSAVWRAGQLVVLKVFLMVDP